MNEKEFSLFYGLTYGYLVYAIGLVGLMFTVVIKEFNIYVFIIRGLLLLLIIIGSIVISHTQIKAIRSLR